MTAFTWRKSEALTDKSSIYIYKINKVKTLGDVKHGETDTTMVKSRTHLDCYSFLCSTKSSIYSEVASFFFPFVSAGYNREQLRGERKTQRHLQTCFTFINEVAFCMIL